MKISINHGIAQREMTIVSEMARNENNGGSEK
jgi:hypothetical protein